MLTFGERVFSNLATLDNESSLGRGLGSCYATGQIANPLAFWQEKWLKVLTF